MKVKRNILICGVEKTFQMSFSRMFSYFLLYKSYISAVPLFVDVLWLHKRTFFLFFFSCFVLNT